MNKFLCFAFGLLLSTAFAFSAEDVAHAVEGTVQKIDTGAKTVAVKTSDGAERTFHYTDRTTVHGVKETEKGTGEALDGLKEGSEVAVHYTDKGAVRTAEEIDHIGRDGLKTGEGTIEKIDRGSRTLTLKTAGGTEETYRLSEHAARDTGLELGKAGKDSGKATVYYTDEAGHKVARFFKTIL